MSSSRSLMILCGVCLTIFTNGCVVDSSAESMYFCENGQSQCSQLIVQNCVNGQWSQMIDCSLDEKICASINDVAMCISKATDTSSETNEDADTDDELDTVANADTDADVETDADNDTDADTNAEADTEADSYTDNDSSIDVNDTDTGPDCVGNLVWYDDDTGLCWQKFVYDQEMNYQSALEHCTNNDTNGYEDWRIPNIDELRTIVDGCEKTEFLDLAPEVNCPVHHNSDYSDWNINCEGCNVFEGNGDSNCYLKDDLENCFNNMWSSSNTGIIDSNWYINFPKASIYEKSKDGNICMNVRCIR